MSGSENGTLVDGYSYTYNRAGDRTSRGNALNSNYSESYSYDGLSRLVDTNRNGTDLQDWGLDALGNWSGFTDGALTQTRESNAANETTGISGSWADPTYDAAGNMTSGPKAGEESTRLHFVYDAWNRLVAVLADDSGELGATIATYAYDGRGYRVQKSIADGDTFDYYYNDQHQVVEVRKSGDTDAYEQYVCDQRYIDAPVMVYRDTDTDGASIEKVYVTQDANFGVTAILDGATGAAVNRFVYTPYGQRTVLTVNWVAGTTSFALGHQGLYLDDESGLYYNRARYYHPTLGRFIQRDPLGYMDGGNLYQYERGDAVTRLDPDGTKCRIAIRCSGVSIPMGPSHCGVVIDDGEGALVIDGSGGRENQMGVSIPAELGSLDFRSFPDSACACLRNNIQNWNSHHYRRWDLQNNSNWSMKCYLGGCGLTAQFTGGFPPGAAPVGWNDKYCNRWSGKPYCSRCTDWTECPRDYQPAR